MPVVPSTQGPRVALGGLPNARMDVPNVSAPDVRLATPKLSTGLLSSTTLNAPMQRASIRDPGALRRVEVADTSAQYTAAGRALGQVSGVLDKAVMEYQTKVNATVVDDALNSAREDARTLTYGTPDGKGGMAGGYRNQKGWAAINRESGKGLDDEVAEEFDNRVKAIAKNKITNADQRYAFEAQVKDMAAQVRQGAAIYSSEQFNSYFTSVYTGMVENGTEDFALQDPGDRAGQTAAMGKIEGAVATLAAHRGDSDQAMEVGMRAARGKAVASLFDRVMGEDKYDTAQALINEWGGKLDANTVTRMKSALDGKVEIQVGEQIGEQAWRGQGATAFNPPDTERAFNVVTNLETRNRQTGRDGRVMTSSAGAYGIAQTMPDTAKEVAKKLGRPELADLAKQPTKEGEAASRLLGQTYFNDMVLKFKGDIPKAMAAYNAGPGALLGGKDSKGNKIEGAIPKAARLGGSWQDYLPAETKAYVANGTAQYGKGEGAPAKPTRQALYDTIDSRTSDPNARRAAYSWVDRRMSAAEADERDGHENAYASALTMVRENGGNINAVPQALKNAVRADQWDGVQTYAKNTAEGHYITTKPEAYQVWMQPETLKTATAAQLQAARTELSTDDFNRVAKAWQDVHSAAPGKGPDSLDTGLVDGLLNRRLAYAGINPSPTKTEKQEMARVGAIRQFVHNYVTDRQREDGAKITDYVVMEKLVNGLFLRDEKFKNLWGKDATVNVMTAKAHQIPASDRKVLTEEFSRLHGGRKPTDAEVLTAYYRAQFYEQ